MAITGKSGSIKIGAVVVSAMASWKLDLQGDVKEVTNFQSNGWKENISGIKSWSGSSDGQWNVSADVTGQTALQNALLNGTIMAMVYNLDGTHNYSGNALVKKISIDEAVDGVVKFSVDYEGTGALAYV